MPVIRTTVQQVLVPAVVTDQKGHYVPGLKPSDFQVFEDDTLQNIVSVISTTSAATAFDGASPSVTGNSPAVRTPDAHLAIPRRTYLVCVDVLHSSFANFAQVRSALKKFFEQEESGDSQYSLVALGRQVNVIQDSTRDPAAVLSAIQSKKLLATIADSEAAGMARDMQQFRAFMKNVYCAQCACESVGSTTDSPGCLTAKAGARGQLLSAGERTAYLDQNFLRGLNELVKATAGMPTSRTIVFISDGFNRFPGRELYAIMDGFGPKDRSFEFNPRNTGDFLQSVLKLAVRYDVKFYTLDSRGLYTQASIAGSSFDASSGGIIQEKVDQGTMSVAHENTDALAQLAHETGGLFFENSNDLFKGIHRAFADGRESYIIAYVPKNTDSDGHYRKIRVEVKGKKYTINAKAGYWATSGN
jgi:VWFA-related protein